MPKGLGAIKEAKQMDLNIILWLGGMLFSLSIFAVKVGFGLGFGGIRKKVIFLTLSLYLVLFVLVAMLSEQIIKILEPILRKGPYLHAFIATGMIAWGVFTLRKACDNHKHQKGFLTPSFLLLIPCPVCMTAMTFSTWTALNVIKLPSPLVGLGLGITFAVLSLLFLAFAKLKSSERPEISLGLSMITIGIYFIASLFLPAKIEEAKGVYMSFLADSRVVDINNAMGVLTVLLIAMLIGYFSNFKKGDVANEYSCRT